MGELAGPVIDGVQRSADWPASMRYLMEFEEDGTTLVGGYETPQQAADHAAERGVRVLKIVLLGEWAQAFVDAQPRDPKGRRRHG